MIKSDKVILQSQKIIPIIKKLRKQGKTIVLTQGSFDMVHIGHGRYCQEAKKFGDVLIVGVDSDKKVQKRKGPNRPVVPEEERLEMMMFLSSVDYVVLKKLKVPKYNLIELIRPDVLIATDKTYTQDQIDHLQTICGEVVVLEPMATTSTSAKLRRLQIGAAKEITKTLSKKFVKVMEEMIEELKNGDK
ncbi:MAG: adenylyltransferase/cytidyltransferase family protein [Candidatus Pacebacteria bacterium]|nr:adenylyltransferase/cytidyltransferase family protein [Candidatus Paceibacterota bacterium]MBT3512019.1 adenylyltransferase/cytidyltransferase family protein [Candidatus Paceibacterota bacterium]MBT4004871.1 adenylyltransferase/cytidyltransferase family protein [Candidatus Paceibacterota bacterium]MBT4359050.1 adenylyltransferase/cytidyltransferase family protein [Candidatus Paceibacterota bacterium]MBT4680537.1 adenylyltransferase/cytidyltransferase family protein [Candidatus Paceibacterota